MGRVIGCSQHYFIGAATVIALPVVGHSTTPTKKKQKKHGRLVANLYSVFVLLQNIYSPIRMQFDKWNTN